ncbi:apolipoprotein N-acyltransferase [Sphaerisporangium melleum]|uniref:Apolipoprotein N-acyltransferase n=1 Tax=Sphaerisporangium melleum TaxID=321316 RepID=A0A917VRS3_9ACTN|nr:apolipoprotein N-acyltransferase [Sphaerisporangium melleum]GGL07760.1 apolipoprotein N-acyltransferase [Sphaerisporangium melleum]GII74270.1 apolipoprotein N-acyltransferase [Sphaerisporangium melleum]
MANPTVQDVERAPAEPAAPPPARTLRRLCAGLAGGVLLYLAFPPIDLWFLAPPALALLTLSVYRIGARRAALLGYAAGAAFLLPALAWVQPIGYDAWLLLVAVEGLFFAAMSAAIALVTRLRGWPLWAACLWVAQELARGAFPVGGFPWVRVAFSQGGSPFTPYAALGGAPLVTFSVVLCGTLLSVTALRAVTPGGRRVAGAALAGALVVPLLAYAVPRPGPQAGPTVRIGIVQGNVPGTGMGFLGDEPAVVLRNHADKTHELARAVREGKVARPDIVIWPENSTDIDPYRDPGARALIDDAVRDIGVPLLVGAVTRSADGLHRYTRAIVWDPVTGPGAYYDKRQLVPFGEYVPYKDLIEKIDERVKLVGLQSVPGDRPGDLRMGPVTVGTIACYEIAFDGIVRSTVRTGASPLVVPTNNATYALTGLPPQQLAMSRLRAVEHDRAVITAATTGISAYVDPGGNVRWRTAERVADMAVVTVPVRTGETIATRVGAAPEWALTLLGAGALAAAVALRRRRPAVLHDRSDEEGG